MLTATPAWKEAARAGTAAPSMLVEIRPTVLYGEKNFNEDWAGGSNLTNLDTGHFENALRLAAAEVDAPDKQLIAVETDAGFRHWRQIEEGTSGLDTYEKIGQYVQTFSSAKSFRLKKLWVGVYNHAAKFRGKLIIRLYSHLSAKAAGTWRVEAQKSPFGSKSGLATSGLYESARLLHTIEYDCSRDTLANTVDANAPKEGTDFQGNFKIFDCSEANVWIPGGNVLCAIDMRVDVDTEANNLRICGSKGADGYTGGQLLQHDHFTSRTYKLDYDLAFKFVADGFSLSGSGEYLFDMGEVPGGDLTGEVELKYSDPPGSSVAFQVVEHNSLVGFPLNWKTCSDGAVLSGKRYVKVKAVLTSTTGLETPRIFSIRVAYKRSDKFVLGRRSLGYSPLVFEAPDYSAEGDPLGGEAKAADTSRLVLSTACGMIPRLFSLYPMKNDEVKISLGFDGLAETDYLPYKTLLIEDWQIDANYVVINGYDQGVKIKDAEAPVENDPPELTEKIFFSLENPATIKMDLLKRAKIRPSKIDVASFTALAVVKSDYLFNCNIPKPKKISKIDSALNRHLLSIQWSDERGLWRVACVDPSATPVAVIENRMLLSESVSFGRADLRNQVALLYGGAGEAEEEEDYSEICVDWDEDSWKDNKEFSTDKLVSQFIPASADPHDVTGVPLKIARARLELQKYGVRSINFTTGLFYADLQLGDHVQVYSQYYTRHGVATPNPLTVMIVRKQISPSLAGVDFCGLVVKDNEESAGTSTVVAAPTGLTITPDGAGGVVWQWNKSPDDNGTNVVEYELFVRLGYQTDYPATPKARVAATGAASYTYSDPSGYDLVRYDFCVRAVGLSVRRSERVEVSDTLVTSAPLAALSLGAWAIAAIADGYRISVVTDLPRASYYRVYAKWYAQTGYQPIGKINVGAGEAGALVWTPPSLPEGTKLKGGGTVSFKLAAVDSLGQEGTQTAALAMSWMPTTALAQTFTAPTLDASGGTYPQVTTLAKDTGFVFSVRLKVVVLAAEIDDVEHIEVERRDDGGTSKVTWGAWGRLPEKVVRQSYNSYAASADFFYDNADDGLKVGRYYQWRVRAVGKNGEVSAWSTSAEKLIVKDATVPDTPVLTVTALPLGLILNISKITQGGGGACPTFSHYLIEGSKDAGSTWIDLAKHFPGNMFWHELPNASIAEAWRFRVTAYTFNENASPVSSVTGDYSAQKVGTDAIQATAVTTSHLNFTPVTGDNVVASINASSEGIDITGARITIDGDVVFSSDAEIYGQIKSVNTSDADERIEFGTFDGDPEIRLYGDDTLTARLRLLSTSDVNIAILNMMASDPLGYGNTYESIVCGWGIDPGASGALYLPDAANISKTYNLATGTRAKAFWDATNHKLKILEGSTTYTFSPD